MWTELAGIVVGIAGLGLAVFTAWLQRRHNFKSLRPLAQIRFWDYEDCVAVRVANDGLGPLIMRRFDASDGTHHKANLIDWMPPHPTGMLWDTYYEELSGVTVLPGNEVVVLKLEQGETDPQAFSDFRAQVRAALAPLSVQVDYSDVYNRAQSPATRSLNWFGRDKPKQRRNH